MASKKDEKRHDELRQKAIEDYLEKSSTDVSDVIDCLDSDERREYLRLEHKIYGICPECDHPGSKGCEFSCVCGENGDPTCDYCIDNNIPATSNRCPALKALL